MFKVIMLLVSLVITSMIIMGSQPHRSSIACKTKDGSFIMFDNGTIIKYQLAMSK
jgi:S-adenosylmethionine hydrolase